VGILMRNASFASALVESPTARSTAKSGEAGGFQGTASLTFSATY
jgi:hypothetical protein